MTVTQTPKGEDRARRDITEVWAWWESGGQISLVLRDQGAGLNEHLSKVL